MSDAREPTSLEAAAARNTAAALAIACPVCMASVGVDCVRLDDGRPIYPAHYSRIATALDQPALTSLSVVDEPSEPEPRSFAECTIPLPDFAANDGIEPLHTVIRWQRPTGFDGEDGG
jgi:hypothetical protein